MRPIVLIPGIGGSILIHKQRPMRTIVGKQVIHNRWLNVYPFIPNSINEWKQDMKCVVEYSPSGKVQGVKPCNTDIVPYDVGGTSGIQDVLPEFLLLPSRVSSLLQRSFNFRYFFDQCAMLREHGYSEGESLFGIPYDFRLVLDPEYRVSFFNNIVDVIEQSTHLNSMPAVVATHSLGSLMFKWFLSTHVDQEWIDRHIHSVFLISPPFGGSIYALKTVIVGDFYIPNFHHMYKDELQTNTGIIACLPNYLGFDDTSKLLTIGNRSITQADYSTLYNDGHVSFKIWHDLYRPHIPDILRPVNVKCHVIHGCQIDTPIAYDLKLNGSIISTTYAKDGDGIIQSLTNDMYAKMFPDTRLQITKLSNVKHTDITANTIVMRKILEDGLDV